jgi:hypothetical protein
MEPGRLNRAMGVGPIDRRTSLRLRDAKTCCLNLHEAQLVGVGEDFALSGMRQYGPLLCLLETERKMTPDVGVYRASVFLRRRIVGVPRSTVSDGNGIHALLGY